MEVTWWWNGSGGYKVRNMTFGRVMSEDWRSSVIVPLYKGKREKIM